MNKRVLIAVDGNCPYIPEMLEMLAQEGIETKQADLSRMDMDGLVEQASDCTSVIACTEHYDDMVFDQLPNLKCIVKSGVGLDSINIPAATRHGVVVSNTPGANGEAVAEMAVTMILSM
ncbi:MAG: phosphoglycerate dehydrogenase, partial [Clostridia bacterium]